MLNSTMSDGGVNDSDDVVYHCDEMFDFETISGAIFILILIFSLTGNILLLCVLVINKNLKNVTNLFILNLAISDLVFTVTLPFWAVYYLHHWVFGDFACKFVTAAYIVGLYSSVILLTAMTVDRFITVVLQNWPRSHKRRQRCAAGACAAAWVISMAASVSDAIKVKVETHWNNLFTCEGPSDGSDVNLGYYLQVSLLFFLPFAIIVFCYSAILKTVLQTSNRKRLRTVVAVFCIVTAFFICWGPYHIVLVVQSVYKPIGCYAMERLYTAYSICHILAFSHCCMNPLLYMLSQRSRRHLLQLLHCKNARRNNRERTNGQSTSVIQNAAFIAQNSAVMLELPSK
ncbi:chemokine XC receptor 1-like [Chaetodon trifascialis]|uniref:chemokine XC receptor 1-like n=1 Tax=Chaetodon trifascialis TaxID=109706 RepID=UPI00399538D3